MSSSSFRTTRELEEMIEWTGRYSPVILKGAGFCIMLPNGTLKERINEFVMLSATSTQLGLLATNEAVLAMVRRSSTSMTLMLYNDQWQHMNYYGPETELREIIASGNRPPEPIVRKSRSRKKKCSVA
jgi:hypothetical protein